jgi:hypothetical protein
MLALSFLASACTEPAAAPPPSVPVTAPAPAPAPEPAEDEPAEVRASKRELSLEHDRAEIGATIPVLKSNDPALQRALDTINGKLAKMANDAMKGMAEQATEEGDSIPAELSFALDLTCEPSTLQEDLVSILCTFDTYSGGAHPNRNFRSRNFTIDGGKVYEIDLATLMSGKPATQSLGQYATNDLKKKKASFVEDGPLPADKLEVFTIEKEGLHLHFAPYVVGSYAEGAYDFLLHWDEAENLIRRSPHLRPVLGLARSAPKRIKTCEEHAGACEKACGVGFNHVSEATGCAEGTMCCVPEPG